MSNSIQVINQTHAVIVFVNGSPAPPSSTTNIIIPNPSQSIALTASFPASLGWLAAPPLSMSIQPSGISTAIWTYACSAYAYMSWASIRFQNATLTISPIINLTLMMGTLPFGYANDARSVCATQLNCAADTSCAPAPACVYDASLTHALPLLPQTPFAIQRLTGGMAPTVAHLGSLPTNCSTSTCTGALQFSASYPPMPLMFVPRADNGPGYTLFQPASTTELNPQAVSFADTSLPGPGQLAVMLYNGMSTLGTNVAGPRTHSVLLFLPDGSAPDAAYVLTTSGCDTDGNCSVAFQPVTNVLEFDTCIGFATPVATPSATVMACMLVLPLPAPTCALRTTGAYNCWAPTQQGCPWGQTACTVRDTAPGIMLCSAPCSSTNAADAAQARMFITDVCATRHVTASNGLTCRTVAGAFSPPSACSGWTTHAFASPCAAACALTSSLRADCDLYKTQYCQQYGSDADCACLAVDTSSLRVPSQNNMSFPEYACAVQALGANSSTSLLPQCWWPTCALTSNAILTSAYNKVTAPAAYAAMCPDTYTRCIVAAQNISPDIAVHVNTDCPQQEKHVSPINCNNMATTVAATSALTPAQRQALITIGAHALGVRPAVPTTLAANDDMLAGTHLQATPSHKSNPSHMSGAEIGYIVGGCVGGALLIVLVTVLAVHFTRRAHA